MATLNKTGGATIVVSTQTVQYSGNAANQFFGGSSDRIAMLAFDAPSALGTDESVSTATLKCWVTADTTPDSDNITIGLIDGSWNGGDSGFPSMYAAITASAVSYALGTGTASAEVSIPVAGLLQMWASNPSNYSGLYLRCPTLSLTRVGATGCSIEYTTITQGAAVAPTSVNLSGLIVEYAPTLSWSGASGGTNNDLAGFEIQYCDSNDGISYGSWQTLTTIYTTETSGSQMVPLPASRGIYRWIRIRTLGAAGINSPWVNAVPFKYNSAPGAPIFSYPQHNGTTFNKNHRFLITMGTEPDGHLMTLEPVEGYPPFKASSPAPYHSGQRVVIQRSDAGQYTTEGDITMAVSARDEYGISGNAAIRQMGAVRWSMWMGLSSFDPGSTRIMAEHITELRLYVQYLRQYYGLEFVDWTSGDVIAGTTPLSLWSTHIQEIREALNLLIQRVNSWDETAVDCLVEVPEWIPITGTQPRADVMQQICDVISSL